MITEKELVMTHDPGLHRKIEDIMWEEGYLAFSPGDVKMISVNLYRIYGDLKNGFGNDQILREIQIFYNS